jgi:hypothetical protein
VPCDGGTFDLPPKVSTPVLAEKALIKHGVGCDTLLSKYAPAEKHPQFPMSVQMPSQYSSKIDEGIHRDLTDFATSYSKRRSKDPSCLPIFLPPRSSYLKSEYWALAQPPQQHLDLATFSISPPQIPIVIIQLVNTP